MPKPIPEEFQYPEIYSYCRGRTCAKTIYTYIDKGEIPGVGNETLWEKRMRGKNNKSLHRRANGAYR